MGWLTATLFKYDVKCNKTTLKHEHVDSMIHSDKNHYRVTIILTIEHKIIDPSNITGYTVIVVAKENKIDKQIQNNANVDMVDAELNKCRYHLIVSTNG